MSQGVDFRYSQVRLGQIRHTAEHVSGVGQNCDFRPRSMLDTRRRIMHAALRSRRVFGRECVIGAADGPPSGLGVADPARPAPHSLQAYP